ncbi:hypothetical protein ACU686_23925 [Yinghuangia aomiensis]
MLERLAVPADPGDQERHHRAGAGHRGAPRGVPRRHRRTHRDPRYPSPGERQRRATLGCASPVTDDELTKQKQAGKDDLQRSDQVSRTGLERTYDTDLRGKTGVTKLAVDNLGNVIGTVSETPATPGNHLVTSIDARVQAVAEQQLNEACCGPAAPSTRATRTATSRATPARSSSWTSRPAGSWRWRARRPTTRTCGSAASRRPTTRP